MSFFIYQLNSSSIMKKCFQTMKKFSNILQKETHFANQLQQVEIMTRDYKSFRNVIQYFVNNNVQILDLEKTEFKQGGDGNAQNKYIFETPDGSSLTKLIFDIQERFKNIVTIKNRVIPEVPWYPQNNEDLKTIGKGMIVDEEANKDHPQFTDFNHRARLEEISKISTSHIFGSPIPIIKYTQKEVEFWKSNFRIFRRKVQNTMCNRYLSNLSILEKELNLANQIPQLRDIDQFLQNGSGVRLKAVPGIMDQREFLNALAHRVFCCTQYIRHHDYPDYSPEPDIIHEILGHVPLFMDKEAVDISQEIGILSCGAKKSDLSSLGKLYWYTMEFGAVKENGVMKAYGAGIASSIGESDNFHVTQFEKLNPTVHSQRSYPSQILQPTYMYCDSFEETIQQIRKFGKTIEKPFNLYYEPKTQKLKTDRRIRTYFDDN